MFNPKIIFVCFSTVYEYYNGQVFELGDGHGETALLPGTYEYIM